MECSQIWTLYGVDRKDWLVCFHGVWCIFRQNGNRTKLPGFWSKLCSHNGVKVQSLSTQSDSCQGQASRVLHVIRHAEYYIGLHSSSGQGNESRRLFQGTLEELMCSGVSVVRDFSEWCLPAYRVHRRPGQQWWRRAESSHCFGKKVHAADVAACPGQLSTRRQPGRTGRVWFAHSRPPRAPRHGHVWCGSEGQRPEHRREFITKLFHP